MRPEGVRQRYDDLVVQDTLHLDAHPELGFRTDLARFINLAARQGFPDLPVSSSLRALRAAAGLLDEPTQRRTDTDFERRCIECVQQLGRVADEFAIDHPDASPLDTEDGLHDPFVHLPRTIVLGEDGPDGAFDLICWNMANCLAEGVRRPYWASRPIVHAAYHRPADAYGLVPPLTALCERYEDHPDDRAAVAGEIADVLTRFLAVAPWPR